MAEGGAVAIGKPILRLDTKEEDVLCLCRTSGDRLISGHHSLLKIWSTSDGSLIHTVPTQLNGEVTCVCQSPAQENCVAISVAETVLVYDLRELSKPLHLFQFNKEEINEIDIHQKGNFLCACDDAGEITVIDIENAKLFKTLSRCHSNICSSVKFLPRKPWELISGGLDCKLVRWDFNRGRPIAELSTQENSDQSGAYMFNPPMVHCVDVIGSTSSVVCGLGNGSVAVCSLGGRSVELATTTALHSASISRVACAEVPEGSNSRTLVISGGNDGRIFVSELKNVHSSERPKKSKGIPPRFELEVVSSVDHRSKVNWLSVGCSSVAQSYGRNVHSRPHTHICVADQTSYISMYDVNMF